MICTVRPVGREEYALSLDGLPVFSSAIFGGYEQAQIPCQLDEEQRLYARGARLRIHGETGIVWVGYVTRRPSLNEPLIAQGRHIVTTYGRREAMYCDTSLGTWTASNVTPYTPNGWSAGMGVATLDVSIAPGTYAQYTKVMYSKLIPTTAAVRITGNVTALPDAALEILVYSSSTEGSLGTLAQTLSATGSFTVDISAAGRVQLSILVRCNASYSPATDKQVTISDLKVYGVSGVTTVNTGNVIKDIITNEVSTTYLPAGAAYQAWLDSETTVVEPLVFDSCDASTKIEELTKYVPYCYGWYNEMVGASPYCVPHWNPRSNTPDYIVRLEEAEAHDLDESALDELISATRVSYQDPNGRTVYVDRTDTDTTHPLVAAGIVRYGDLQVQTSSTAGAQSYGDVNNSEQGRDQVKGTVTTRKVYTATGADVYLPDIRPGQMVRLMGLPDGAKNVIVKRAVCTGDKLVALELDNEPYRLDLALARLSKRNQ